MYVYVDDKVIEIVLNLNMLFKGGSELIICQKLLPIHPKLLKKDNFFKTLPVEKLVKILALRKCKKIGFNNSLCLLIDDIRGDLRN